MSTYMEKEQEYSGIIFFFFFQCLNPSKAPWTEAGIEWTYETANVLDIVFTKGKVTTANETNI